MEGRRKERRYVLHVRDNDPGIPPTARVHLFEPSFTTKPGEHGLSLGLILSVGLATAIDGSLSMQHPESDGTAFKLSLSLVPDSPTMSPAQ